MKKTKHKLARGYKKVSKVKEILKKYKLLGRQDSFDVFIKAAK